MSILCLLTVLIAQLNPATVPVPQRGMEQRHAEKVALIQNDHFDLMLIGDSITQNFEKPEYQPTWNRYFAPRHAINLGYSGGRTENTLWNLEHGELTNQSPKVAVLMIGTNNADERNYPTHHTADQIAGGISDIVDLLKSALPNTKILLLAPFPYGEHPAANSRGQVLIRVADLIRPLADGQRVFFLNVNRAFLKPDGSVDHDLMPDYLHPSPAGALAWAKAMEPTLNELMVQSSH